MNPLSDAGALPAVKRAIFILQKILHIIYVRKKSKIKKRTQKVHKKVSKKAYRFKIIQHIKYVRKNRQPERTAKIFNQKKCVYDIHKKNSSRERGKEKKNMKKEINNTTEINTQEENNNMKNTMKKMIMAEASEIKNEELKNLTIRVRTQRAIDALHDQWNRVCMHIDDVPAEEMSEEYAEFIRKINYADRLISNASEQGELTDIDYGRNIYKKQVRTHRDSEDIHIQQFISEWDRTENEIAEIKAEIQELRDMWKAAGGYNLWEQRDTDEQAMAEVDLDTEERRDADTAREEQESLERGWAELIEMEKTINEAKTPSKKDEMIETVENIYDIVGAARTINNYTGISDDEIDTDYVEYIVRHLFSDDEMQEQRNKERLIEYYEKQPEIFFDDIDSEDLVIRMAEDLAKIQYDDLIKRYGFKELSYAPYNPEFAASEANYNREMSLELAGTKCEIVESMPELEDVVKSKKISDKNFCRLINMYKKCGFKDWKDKVILPNYVAYDAARCHDQDWLVDYVIDKSVIRGE